ncbi:hypothetical protein [Demequina subtropica]|uniref:hypothetical protein n=1 Tax=Demequina subtropica TaxID=1638989 RepID=UPI000782CE5D|nr:hypothetical protein [Demequina subtropica]
MSPDSLTAAKYAVTFDRDELAQFEEAELRFTAVVGEAIERGDATVLVSWTNEAELETAPGAFEVRRTSSSRQSIDASTARGDGTYELVWSWAVTPLMAGEQSLTVTIVPTVRDGEGREVDMRTANEPVVVDVEVHPVQRAVDEVAAEAAHVAAVVPEHMQVDRDYEVSVEVPLHGHGDDIAVELDLVAAPGSAAVTIRRQNAASAAQAGGGGPVAFAMGGARTMTVADAMSDVARARWTVTPEEAGPVLLAFTATVRGEAGTYSVETGVETQASARASGAPASFWDRLKEPVDYLGVFVGFAVAVLGLWGAVAKIRSNRRKGGGDGEAAA